MGTPDRLIDDVMQLDGNIRSVSVLLDGRRKSRERGGLESDVAVDPGAIEGVSLQSGGPVFRKGRGAARQVVIRRGTLWQVEMSCRGGNISIDVDHGVDPFEIAALASDVLLTLGL